MFGHVREDPVKSQLETRAIHDESREASAEQTPDNSLWRQLATTPPAGGGHPLPALDRRFFESSLGHDFGDVRLHTDAKAARAAQAYSAQAFTQGRDIYFGAGQYRPHAIEGRRLLAHELAHTAQHSSASAGAMPIMRKPLPGEDAAAAKVRLGVVDDAKASIEALEKCLAKDTPCNADETITGSGDFSVKGWGNVVFVESKATHHARLARLVADLKDIKQQLESAPVPAGALADVSHDDQQARHVFSGYPIDNIYVHRSLKQGPDYATALNNVIYLDHVIEQRKQQPPPAPGPAKQKKPPPPPKTTKTVPAVTKPSAPADTTPPPAHFEEDTGYHLVVPDPKGAPLVYHPLTTFGDNRGHILNVRRDEGGYFYRGDQNTKVYLKNWQPSPDGL